MIHTPTDQNLRTATPPRSQQPQQPPPPHNNLSLPPPAPQNLPQQPPPPQLHPARVPLLDLLNLYLGRNAKPKQDDSIAQSPNKMQRRITAPNKGHRHHQQQQLPPSNQKFLLDFDKLRLQFHSTDQEQLRGVTESVLISLAVECSGHAAQAEFILFAAKGLSSIGCVNWDTFLPALLYRVSSLDSSLSASSSLPPSVHTQMMGISLSTGSNLLSSNPTSPLGMILGSPTHSTTEQAVANNVSPVKPPDTPVGSTQQQQLMWTDQLPKADALSYLRRLSCKLALAALESNLKPATHADILSHTLNWIVNWDQRQGSLDEADRVKEWKPQDPLNEWLHLCLDVIWMLVDEGSCRVPFYELLRSGLQFIGNIPDDEALFTMILEIHRRRDLVAMHMKMLDQHIQCPSFGTHRFLSHAYPNTSGEPQQPANVRYSPITYPSVLGEPLHGEDLASSIPKGSLDWDRALRCLTHALGTTPSPEWWRRVLFVAPCYRQQVQLPMPGAVFSPDMICVAVIDRTMDLLTLTNSDTDSWYEWLSFADVFFFLMKSGCIDFLDFVNKLSSRVANVDQQLLQTNHVTWLLAQIIRIEIVMSTLSTDPRKVETTRKIISFHREDRNSDINNQSPQSILLDFISSSQTLRIWSLSVATREYLNNDQIQKGKQIDEWLKHATKGERMIDFNNMDDRTMGMLWVLSFTMAQPACEAIVNWFTSSGVTEIIQGQPNERMTMMRETSPLSITFLSGLSIHLCLKLAYQLEETIFLGQVVPSIAVVETYVRLLLVAPYSLFRPHFTTLTQRSTSILNKPGISLLLLEILNYRLLPLYRYHGKHKTLMYDVTKIIAMLKAKRGEHRLFRLAENLCMNLILSMRDFFLVKKELKGSVEFTETLSRLTIVSLAINIKIRGIAEVDHIFYVQHLLDQVMASCSHTWSEKTMQHFPPLIREFLLGRTDKKAQTIQAWQQVETTVILQCKQLLSSTADPSYAATYLSCSFPQHRQYLCSGAWIIMSGRPENINSTNLGRVLREFSPDEVTCNIYTMVDVLLHHIHVELQHGHLQQDLLMKATTNLSFLVWQQELLPLDILLLALIDRDDDSFALRIVLNMLERTEIQQRVKLFCANRGSPDHWLNSGMPKRLELQKALGNHLSWKDRYPVFYDDIAARLLPVVPLIIYRLIENGATDHADRVLVFYSSFLRYHPFRFTFVREILAYFYGHLPSKLITHLLQIIDIPKIPFSESFPQYLASSNPAICPPREYFVNLLLGLVNNVIPPLGSKSKCSTGDTSSGYPHAAPNRNQTTPPLGATSDGRGSFYQNQDTGTYTQLVLETAVIEILSLPITASQTVSSLLQIVVHIQPTLIQSHTGLQGMTTVGQGSTLPTSPSAGGNDPLNTNRSNLPAHANGPSNFMSRSDLSCQQLSCLMIQACGLLLAQLPVEFQLQLYSEASRIIKDCWWLNDNNRSMKELDSAIGYALTDPTWAAQDNTSTAIGNTVALLHSLFSNLPQEWLETTHMVIKHLRPLTSVATLRIAFRILGPLFPRLSFYRPVFFKTLALLFNCMSDVFGMNTQPPTPVEASEIADIIDFLHHVVMCEGQGGPVQSSTKPKAETLTLCGKAMEMLRPDVQHLLSHLRPDTTTSIYAATHPKLMQNPT